MSALRMLTTFLDVIFILIILYFSRGLTWEKDKASIIGFVCMGVTFWVNMLLIWCGKR